eukprot:g8726.t1
METVFGCAGCVAVANTIYVLGASWRFRQAHLNSGLDAPLRRSVYAPLHNMQTYMFSSHSHSFVASYHFLNFFCETYCDIQISVAGECWNAAGTVVSHLRFNGAGPNCIRNGASIAFPNVIGVCSGVYYQNMPNLQLIFLPNLQWMLSHSHLLTARFTLAAALPRLRWVGGIFQIKDHTTGPLQLNVGTEIPLKVIYEYQTISNNVFAAIPNSCTLTTVTAAAGCSIGWSGGPPLSFSGPAPANTPVNARTGDLIAPRRTR